MTDKEGEDEDDDENRKDDDHAKWYRHGRVPT